MISLILSSFFFSHIIFGAWSTKSPIEKIGNLLYSIFLIANFSAVQILCQFFIFFIFGKWDFSLNHQKGDGENIKYRSSQFFSPTWLSVLQAIYIQLETKFPFFNSRKRKTFLSLKFPKTHIKKLSTFYICCFL